MTQNLSDRVRLKASELGFCGVGIATAEELGPEGDRLREWLHRGYHGTMDWMESAERKRRDPRAVLEGARSVICLAYNYFVNVDHPADPDRGKISRYAWGDDYHDIVGEKLERLQEFIFASAPGARCRTTVDSGPVMDKAWAVRSGLGWLGKHTNLITRDYGSWVFLGEILTDLALTPDEPIGDFCGTCTACIEACPTGAIVEPYVLDSRRCVSYLTIEHRGEIASEHCALLDNWVFGCDICQDVCPWNRFRKETSDDRLFPREGSVALPLAELEQTTQQEFVDRFRRSPVKRAKLAGLKRNARAVIRGRQDQPQRIS